MTIQVRERVEPEVRVKTVPEVLRHAALVIEERGWYQGAYVNPRTGAVCAWGAFNVAVNGDAEDDSENRGPWREASEVLREYIEWVDIPGWNDKRGRTAAEVTAALRAAADAYETGPVRP